MVHESNSDHRRSSLIGDLARVADQALLLGEHRRCIAIIESIYDLLECWTQEESDAAELEVGRIVPSLEPDLS